MSPRRVIAVALLAAGCVTSKPAPGLPAPEPATGLREVDRHTFTKAAVVAAHPEAARIGAEVLANGGSAIDAAVAVQAALTLVEPQSSGIGGGAFLLYWDAATGKLTAWDGRETAPHAVRPDVFLGADGKPFTFPEAMLGGRSVGVPGALDLLHRVHARYGKKPWSELFTGTADLAERGFTVTPRLNVMARLDPALPVFGPTRDYFFGADGAALAPGTLRPNAPLAKTLRAIAAGGARAFYTGPIAEHVVAAVGASKRPAITRDIVNTGVWMWGAPDQDAPWVDSAGALTLDDLAGYHALEREPLCVTYRRFRICSAPPPSGGVALLQAMKLLEPYDLSKLKPGSPQELHLMLDAEALVDADRERWLADPAFARVPTAGLLDAAYLRERGALMSTERAVRDATAGTPPGALADAVPGRAFEVPSTSHFVIVDAQGSVVSMTTSVEFGFGSHLMVDGFVLNNQLTDFAFTPVKDGKPVLNAVAGGKRPRSSMSPTVVFDESGRVVLAVGSPGGSRIIGYVAQALVGVLDHGLTPNAALAQPHVVSAKGRAEIEDVGWATPQERDALVEALRALGHETTVVGLNSGLHAVGIAPGLLSPGIDPRREGASRGR